MRYLYVTTYPPTRCGIGAYSRQSVEKLREQGHFVDVMSPDLDGNVDFKCDLRGGFKLLRLLVVACFYDRLVVQYHHNFFFKSKNEARSRASNVAVAWSFIILFLVYRRKIELICHEVYDCSIEQVGLVNYIAQRMMWLLGPRLVFHTQGELSAFAKKFHGGR